MSCRQRLNVAHEPLLLVDDGAFDWLQRLGSNHQLMFVASGMGSQLIVQLFVADPTTLPPAEPAALAI